MTAPRTPTEAFFQDPDQPSRRAELAAFFGPNPESFLALYDRTVITLNRTSRWTPLQRRLPVDFCAAAFFAGPAWFFYRKLWFWGAGLIAFMAVTVALFGRNTGAIGIFLSIAMAAIARQAYLFHAIRTIQAIRAQNQETPPLPVLQEAGGVSWIAGWISGTILVLTLLAALLIPGYAGPSG